MWQESLPANFGISHCKPSRHFPSPRAQPTNTRTRLSIKGLPCRGRRPQGVRWGSKGAHYQNLLYLPRTQLPVHTPVLYCWLMLTVYPDRMNTELPPPGLTQIGEPRQPLLTYSRWESHSYSRCHDGTNYRHKRLSPLMAARYTKLQCKKYLQIWNKRSYQGEWIT